MKKEQIMNDAKNAKKATPLPPAKGGAAVAKKGEPPATSPAKKTPEPMAAAGKKAATPAPPAAPVAGMFHIQSNI
jgi:hypothetical protein